jgi:hypothetical protein
MAKCLRNISANEIQELIFYFDSEIEFASNDSDNDFTHDFSEDSDGIVEADEEWKDKRDEDKVTVHHHFTGPDPELIHVVVPDINEHSSSFNFFRLMFTEELFSTILTKHEPLLSATHSKNNSYVQDYNIEI